MPISPLPSPAPVSLKGPRAVNPVGTSATACEAARRSRSASARALVLAVTGVLAVVATACKRDEAPTGAAASASAAASVIASIRGVALPLEVVANQVNRGGLPPYAGPTGTVRGKVTVNGDQPPSIAVSLPPTARCGSEARATYERLFRVGRGGELADAFVGVTDYKAFVPALGPAVPLSIRGCAFERRTVALTYGQRLEVTNLDQTERYLPHLDKAQAAALMVSLPGGDAVPLMPPLPGPYVLVDDLLHPWMNADVLVLKYATGAVSDTLGAYSIDRIPVGAVKVSVMHPHIPSQRLERTVTIEAGKTVEVNFELTYKKPVDPPPVPPAASSAGRKALPPIQ